MPSISVFLNDKVYFALVPLAEESETTVSLYISKIVAEKIKQKEQRKL